MTFKFEPGLQTQTPFKTLPPSVWQFVWETIRPYKWVGLIAYLFLVIGLALGAAFPYFIGLFIDTLTTYGSQISWQHCWWLLLPFLLKAVFIRFGMFLM